MTESSVVLKTEDFEKNIKTLNLIKAAKEDPWAFGELYKIYVEQVFRYLYSRTRNLQEAEDATAQTFLAAFESINTLRQDKNFVPWLFGIARNKAIDQIRKREHSLNIEDSFKVSEDRDSLSQVIQTEQLTTLSKLILSLPEKDRELLRLRFLGELSYQEIARLLHRNKEAVKKSIYRLLARLQNQMEVLNE